VRGRRETLRAPVWFVLAGLVLGLALPAAGGAGPSSQIESLRQRQQTMASREHAALLGLYSLDSRLSRARARLAGLRASEAALRARQAQATHDEAIANAAWHESVLALGARLRVLYEQGQPDALAVMLGATSVDDALTQLDQLQRAARLNRETIQEARASRTALAALRSRLAAQTREVAALAEQAAQTASALEQARAQKQELIASLGRQRSFGAHRIAALETAARRITARSQAAAPPPTGTADPAGSLATPIPGGTQLTVTSTGYSMQGHTATGMPVGWGVVAVDPSVIPLGTRLTIPGYGEGVAADTGGAIQGATIDLWFPTLAQAMAWGRRTVTITLH